VPASAAFFIGAARATVRLAACLGPAVIGRIADITRAFSRALSVGLFGGPPPPAAACGTEMFGGAVGGSGGIVVKPGPVVTLDPGIGFGIGFRIGFGIGGIGRIGYPICWASVAAGNNQTSTPRSAIILRVPIMGSSVSSIDYARPLNCD
jgi:hypothetical protein